jgi:hypothetical protein
MRKNLIDLFFLELSKKANKDTEVILTGAAAGSLFGHSRPSLDIDFEIRPKKHRDAAYLEYLDGVIGEVSSRLGVDTNYGEDIDHGSMIDLLDYRDKTIPYKKMDRLEVRLIAPEYWTIGKMTRFFEIDIQDMVQVIKKKKLDADEMVGLWARALKASPMSLAKRDFITHVKLFIKVYGVRAWENGFKAGALLEKFERLISK